MKEKKSPPKAKSIPVKCKNFHDERVDNYSWLRDSNYPKVQTKEILDYLNDENDYAKEILSSNNKLKEKIYEEIKNKITEDDETVPVKRGDYLYYSYINKGMNYWVHSRKYKSLESEKEIILDENELAKQESYLNVRGIKASPNNKYLSFAIDTNGSEIFTISIKDLKTGELLKDSVPNTFGRIVWNKSNKGFFYVPISENWRAKKVKYHELGTDYKNDLLIFEEKEETFSVNISKTCSEDYLIIDSSSKEENEVHYMNLNNDNFHLNIFAPRKENRLYQVENHEDDFYILTNDHGNNFRIAIVNKNNTQDANWKNYIQQSSDKYLREFLIYQENIVILSSNNKTGLHNIEIINFITKEQKQINFPDKSYHLDIIFTSYDSEGLRFIYSSPKTPYIIKEYNFISNDESVLKQDKMPSDFNSEEYTVDRVYAVARDGEKIPVSLIYKTSLFNKLDGNPVYLYGYGSYGYSVPDGFRKSIFSLVDRGFIYAVAHIRGGDELGYDWYQKAKFLNKKHTFYDFIDSAKYLIKEQYTYQGNITIAGGSAGGMLIGFCINENPELFNTAVAHVPFVDVLNTMLDDTLPLTPGEFKEWGNPKNEGYYNYIKSYSPYDNVKKQNYPNIFVTAGLYDPRVTYWEPAKWVAKLREHKQNSTTIVLKTNMDAGHAGKSGRYLYIWEIADEYSFILQNYNEKYIHKIL